MASRSSEEERPGAASGALGALLGVGGAAAFSQPAVSGSDLWWHLAAGREIATTGGVPEVDAYSHTAAGQPWMNHEWLWDWLYWRVYDLHPDAIAWLQLAVLLALFGAVFASARRAAGSDLAAGAVTWIVAAASHWFLDIRPHVFTLLFVAGLLLVRDRRFAPWLWPPLFAVWVNVHAGFVFGLGVIGLHALVRSFEGAREGPGRRAAWLGVALAMAATLCNPWTWRILEYPLALLDGSNPYRSINEWQAPDLSLDPATYAGRFWITALLWLPGAALARRSDRAGVLVSAVALAMAVTSRRFIPLFAVVAAPQMARALAALVSTARARAPVLHGRAAAGTVLAVAALGTLLLWSGVRTQPAWLYRWSAGFFYPEAAVRYLQEIGGAERLLHLYSWGGYVMLVAPELPVFIDGRALTVYGDDLYEDYLSLQEGRSGTRARLDRYGVDAVLFPEGTGLVQRLRAGPDPWPEVYADRNAVLLLRPDDPRLARALPRPRDVLGPHPDLLVQAARRSAERGDLSRAAERYAAALEANPLLVPVYGEVAALAARRGDRDAVSEAIARGRRAAPRFAAALDELEAGAWQQAGDLERAHAALLRARPASPFQTSRAWYHQMEDLERRLAWRRSGFQGEAPR